MTILRHATQLDLAHAIEANMFEQYPFIFGIRKETEIREDADISWTITRQPYSRMNYVYKTKFKGIDVNRQVTDVISYFKSLRVPFTWIIGPSAEPKNLPACLKENGCKRMQNEAGMAIDFNLMKNEPIKPSDLQMREVNDSEMLRHWFDVVSLCFGIPDAMREILYAYYNDISFMNTNWRLYVGYLDETPIAASNLYKAAGVAGLYHVATLPEHRQKGIGTAMTLEPLIAAKQEGYRYGVLRATLLGEHVYKKLGFREYCRIELWQ